MVFQVPCLNLRKAPAAIPGKAAHQLKTTNMQCFHPTEKLTQKQHATVVTLFHLQGSTCRNRLLIRFGSFARDSRKYATHNEAPSKQTKQLKEYAFMVSQEYAKEVNLAHKYFYNSLTTFKWLTRNKFQPDILTSKTALCVFTLMHNFVFLWIIVPAAFMSTTHP